METSSVSLGLYCALLRHFAESTYQVDIINPFGYLDTGNFWGENVDHQGSSVPLAIDSVGLIKPTASSWQSAAVESERIARRPVQAKDFQFWLRPKVDQRAQSIAIHNLEPQIGSDCPPGWWLFGRLKTVALIDYRSIAVSIKNSLPALFVEMFLTVHGSVLVISETL